MSDIYYLVQKNMVPYGYTWLALASLGPLTKLNTQGTSLLDQHKTVGPLPTS